MHMPGVAQRDEHAGVQERDHECLGWVIRSSSSLSKAAWTARTWATVVEGLPDALRMRRMPNGPTSNRCQRAVKTSQGWANENQPL
jgi:hypothetical protein